jgi:hypothetical protein
VSMITVDRTLEQIARSGCHADDHVAIGEPPAADWEQLRGRIVANRLTGLAVASWGAGTLLLSEAQAEDLLERHREAMVWSLLLEQRLLRIRDRFVSDDIPFVVLKGPAVAHTAYPDPSWRSFADLDLLVPAGYLRRACSSLRVMGFSRLSPELRRGFDERFGKAITHRGPDRIDVDLHRTLAAGPFGVRIDAHVLHTSTDTFELAGTTMRRLDDTGLLLHSCIHAALGDDPPSLHAIRDVVQTAALPGVSWEWFAEQVERWRLVAVVDRAFGLVRRTLGITIDAAGELALRPAPDEVRLVGAYRRAERTSGSLTLETFRAIDGWGSKAAFARSVALPSRSFVRASIRPHAGEGYGTRWARLGRRVMERTSKEARRADVE